MRTYIALFRGINVGGHNVLPMKGLAALLEGLGLHSVRTYIRSGNVVFQAGGQTLPGLSDQIRTAVKQTHGFEPEVLLLKKEDLERAMAANPFPEAESGPRRLHLYFLSSAPANPDVDGLESLKKDTERFALHGNVFYLHAPDGIGRSKLAARAERLIGVPMTGRNWRTVGKIMALAEG